ncbi:HtaA domain-containing protein [Diaminobutyricimonas sp. LJ205]|uniref:HtaA domain-containing protein n=1 Tax=Diaminobutyricimonas sp. LJ205 TaxID=2683590 RepID=UPI0012F4A860|nr:HtaA domain-containing protein [Diaminobutyricimonas sp. LJ205]
MIRTAIAVAALATLGANPVAQAGCTIEDASLDWGFKESFRAYISGSIANGEWTVADGATYTTPLFSWSGGSGALPDGSGEVSFGGSVQFTGHDGILDTTVANPTVRIVDSESAMLLLDVSGTTQQGERVDASQVEFAELELPEATVAAGRTTFVDVPAVLTTSGAEAFGTYEAGTELDPLTLSYVAPADCELAAPGLPAWALWAMGGAAVVGVGVGVVLTRRARRSAD